MLVHACMYIHTYLFYVCKPLLYFIFFFIWVLLFVANFRQFIYNLSVSLCVCVCVSFCCLCQHIIKLSNYSVYYCFWACCSCFFFSLFVHLLYAVVVVVAQAFFGFVSKKLNFSFVLVWRPCSHKNSDLAIICRLCIKWIQQIK